MSENAVNKGAGMSRRAFLKKTTLLTLSFSTLSLLHVPFGFGEEEIHRPLIPEDMTPEEKSHVPQIDMPKVTDDPGIVPIRITMDHPMTEDHFIEWVEILDDKAIFKQKARFYYTPANGKAYLFTNIKVPETTTLKVRAKCNKDGIWEAEMDIKVAGGGKYSC
jgi:desulfoferrodoxin-like iron-binding protein